MRSEEIYKDGVWKKWNDNGQLEREGIYKDGKLDGVWKGWYDNGQLRSEGIYKDGWKEGVLEKKGKLTSYS